MKELRALLIFIIIVPLVIIFVLSPSIFAYVNWDYLTTTQKASSYDLLFGNLIKFIIVAYFAIVGQLTLIVVVAGVIALYLKQCK